MDFDGWKRRPDQVSLSALLKSVEPRVERICRRILRDPHDAEEAKQEVLLEIASGLDAITDGGHFDRWAGRVAFRTAVDRLRMRRRRVARENEAAGRAPNGAARDDDLHESMSRLDDDDRDLLIERYFDRRTLREMGRRRGISAVAVRKRIGGAQDRLKRMLGAGIPIALIVGASTVRAKTVAAAAIILIPLLIGGIWVASSRRSSTGVPRPSAFTDSNLGRTSSTALDWTPLDPSPAQPANDPETVRQNAERESFIQNLKRYRAMSERMSECSRESSRLTKAGTWLKALSEEIQQLEKDMQALYREMQKQVAHFPDVCLAYFNELEWSSLKKAVGGLLTPVIQAEIAADSSQPGPTLRALLPLARGSPQDKSFLLRRAIDLKTGVRELADICFEALEDPDLENRYSAVSALSLFAEKGNLREFFAQHKLKFQEIVKADQKDRPAVFAFLALAGVGTEDADDFILQHWNTARTDKQFHVCVAAMNRIAPRIVLDQEHRIAPALLRALDLEGGLQHDGLIQLAFRLSKEKCVEALRVAITRVPQMEPGMAEGLENIIARIEAGETEAVIQEFDAMVRKSAGTGWAIRTVGRVDLKSLK